MSKVGAENIRSVSVRISITPRHVTRSAGMDGIRLESLMVKGLVNQANYIELQASSSGSCNMPWYLVHTVYVRIPTNLTVIFDIKPGPNESYCVMNEFQDKSGMRFLR